ncbi:hypothetical protein KK137_14600 [Croceibacterium sp. LX-88]|jgi:hypothetical protein|uniref:DoxX family protein n=1 Tax=Croceibacterium selenioxidans TaxID=2838833 RepID=A0ABS5W744_9SPHN|nr:hypothetical protein [Croceibacterium selenioxidans]MBT2135565.1 hypothetical protein [Croceibacterium selenioxidans]
MRDQVWSRPETVTEAQLSFPYPERAPAHLWLVGLALVLWNGWGVAIAVAAQTSRMPVVDAVTTAYFEAQPLWFVLLADIGPFAGLAGAVALLLQSRWALPLFVTQLAVLALANFYELAIGTSLLLSVPEARGATGVLAILLLAQIAYVHFQKRRGRLN